MLIVDDNSRDGTIDIANQLAGQYPLRILVRTQERGLATAVIHGIRNAKGSIIGVMDADLQHPPEILPKLAAAMDKGADIVVASRYIPGGGVPNWGLLRRVVSKGAGTISHVFLTQSRRTHDPMSGFFMFRRDRVDPDKLKPTGYKILLEILLMGDFTNAAEVPFIFEERSAGASKLKWSTQIDYLKHILSLMARTGERAMFIKFIIVGLIGTGVNIGVYTALTRLTDVFADLDWLAVIIGIEVSIITNFLLNDTFTFRGHRAGSSFLGRLLRFNLICLTGAGIQWGILMLLTRLTDINDILANFIGIVVAFLWNYFINRNWTWR
jgi:dolichol-phosphate mannosyltransferase